MEEVLKELIRRLEGTPDNPVAQERASRLKAVLTKTENQFERDLQELRDDQELRKQANSRNRSTALNNLKAFSQFNENVLASIESGNAILSRIVN